MGCQTYQYTFLLILLMLSHVTLAQYTGGDKPNIIFIMADDLGYETLECYGNDNNKTPNINKLAARGMRFTHAYATPLCTPTRVQVMTGKYNFRNYIGFGILDKNQKTFGDLLKEAGYVTGVTGKWQLLGYKKQWELAGGKKGAYPQEVGFDKYCLWQIDTLGSRYKDPVISTNAGTKFYPGEYGPAIFTDFAMDFIEENRDNSFFLYYPMVLTHAPFQPTPATQGFKEFDVGKRVNDTTYFKTMVEYMDKLVGKITDKVHELRLSKNTLIIFTGDNGTDRKVISTVKGKKIRGNKGKTTKYSTHVPLIAYWDGTIKKERVNANLIDFTDFLPTFMRLAGAKFPADFHSDGRSFHKQLLNKESKVRDWVFCSYDPRWQGKTPATWVNNKEWKLYSDDSFYNVQNDPEELKPIPDAALTSKARKIKKEFSRVLKSYSLD